MQIEDKVSVIKGAKSTLYILIPSDVRKKMNVQKGDTMIVYTDIASPNRIIYEIQRGAE